MAAVESIEVAIEFESPKLIRFQSHLRLKNTLSILLLLACLTLQLHAQEVPAEAFEVAGHTAYVCEATTPAEGKPWLWYAPTLRSLAFGERKMYFETFLCAGISIVGFDLGEVRGSPASTAKFTLFYNEMIKRGYSPKPILLGQSRGGRMTLAWAFRNPDKVKAWVVESTPSAISRVGRSSAPRPRH